jgi:deoxyribodipyrimidine photo-lyase
MNKLEVAVFWFRRDLRLEDNVGLFFALQSKYPVIPLFIFDEDILDKLPKNDARVGFIHESLSKINKQLQEIESSILVKKGKTFEIWQELIQEFDVKEVFFNKDYEPYAIKRDFIITILLEANNTKLFSYKDQVIFEEMEITKADGLPYTVYTPYKNKWLEKYKTMAPIPEYTTSDKFSNFYKINFTFPTLAHNLKNVTNYHETRDFPA